MTGKPAPMDDEVLSEADKNMLSYFWEAKRHGVQYFTNV